MSGWVIELLSSGQVDLTKDRHIVGYDLDMDEAINLIRRQDPGAKTVTVREVDGYEVHQRI